MFFGFGKPKSLGRLGEDFAQQHFKKLGYKILGANVFNRRGKRLGEIDFIAVDNNHIVFVEVKTRARPTSKFGTVLESVDFYKQRKILKIAKLFLVKNSEFKPLIPRIDVVSIIWPDVDKKPESLIITSNAVEDYFQ